MAETDASKVYDAVVVGGGPAGLTAALYLARARYRVLVVEKDHFGGQITITSEIVNYPGVATASGAGLAETMRRQAEAFGAEFLLAEVTGLDMEGDVKTVRTTKGDLPCLGVLLATGASPRRVGFAGEEEFRGHGVAYCATCDGEFFTGKDVFVVGGGFAAAEESVFLAKYARHVTILVRDDDFTCAKSTADAARNHEKITVLTNTEVEEVGGDTALRYLRYRNRATGEVTEYRAAEGETFGVFVFVGYAPATELVRGIAEVNEQGYIVTDTHKATTAPGLYAAGDVCVKSLRQVATAIGEAALAATEMERRLAAMHDKTGIVPQAPSTRIASKLHTEGGSAPAGMPADRGAAPGSAASAEGAGGSGALFTPDMLDQLEAVFSRMERPLELRLTLDGTPVSHELKGYMEELASLTEKLSVTVDDAASKDAEAPFVRVCEPGGAWTGLAFHGVPGGHEFTSFVLGLYNAAGPGQPIADADREGIAAIERNVRMKVLVSLSCTMCPELAVAAQRIAAGNPLVTAEVYDINCFAALKERYNVMSVPCLVVNDGEQMSFGKKSLAQVLELIG